MDDTIIATFGLCDDVLQAMHHREDCQGPMQDAAIMPTALLAALFLRGNHASARTMLTQHGDIPHMVRKSRLSRRLHRMQEILILFVNLCPGSRGCGHEWRFLLRRCTSLYHQGDLRYDGTAQKLCRRGTSWPLLCSTSVQWPTCLWYWGASASATSLHFSMPSALRTPRMSSRVAVV